MPLIDQETGEVLERDLVGTLDLLERDAEGLVVVDLKTSARKYTDLQVETALQLSVYSYAGGAPEALLLSLGAAAFARLPHFPELAFHDP